MPHDLEEPKLCLSCARRRLSGLPEKPCATCALLNVDPLAQVRANAARPSPLATFSFVRAVAQEYGPPLKPGRSTPLRGGPNR